MTKVRILGIDPGFDRMGVCVLDKENGKESLVYSSCIITSREATFEDRLVVLGDGLEKIIKQFSPDHLAIETLFFTKNQKTAMMVAEVRGVILYISNKHKLTISEYSPPQIKLAIAGHGRASKDEIAYMISKIIDIPGNNKRIDDEADAIAIALTHSAHNNAYFKK
jgi:crossover junction endodeoxyribonuclease RuvC